MPPIRHKTGKSESNERFGRLQSLQGRQVHYPGWLCRSPYIDDPVILFVLHFTYTVRTNYMCLPLSSIIITHSVHVSVGIPYVQ